MTQIYMMMMALLIAALPGNAQNAKPTRKTARKAAVAALQKPVAKPATNISASGFTANWEPVDGAEGYAVGVFRRIEIPADGEYTLIDEDFSGITEGSLLEPLGGDEDYVNLDDYGYGDNPGWSAYAFPNFVPSMVAGKLYSPYLNLTNNDGKYKVIITTYCTDGDEILVESHGTGETVKVVYTCEIGGGVSGLFTKELEFSNGCEDLFFSIINQTAEVGQADYTDRVQVTQQLKKGDIFHSLVAIDESIDAETESGVKVASKAFSNVTKFAAGATTLYYNIAAGAYNFGYDENGNFTYNYVQSPYSDYVKVDLADKTSEVVDEKDDPDEPTPSENGVLTLGHFDGSAANEGVLDNKVAFDGANWYNAPMAFTYRNSGSQNLYLPEQLAEMKGKDITSISFSCFGADAFYTNDYKSKARIYVSEVETTEFYENPETGYREWFDLDQSTLAATQELELDFLESSANGENITITFDLTANPYRYTGKTLLLTVTNESSQYLETGEYVRFYWIDWKKGDGNRSSIFVNDDPSKDFLYNLTTNKRITATENENENYNAPAVRFTYTEDPVADGMGRIAADKPADNAYYTLQGIRVEKPTKGIYIHNGKKIVVK